MIMYIILLLMRMEQQIVLTEKICKIEVQEKDSH